ncbi:Cof-type HAD-IIB family hydrolase [Treponema berlinense]|uniref:Cof-type HAD-IIB family hydrolase n=1 Tax=Treponema berlinense TaxID=225004 RepID=UPI0023F982D3|nr:Cof-type HAD-IIB family hydrolase [Treponema berlinense]
MKNTGKLHVNLIALDLDDTLLNDERKISDRNVEVLKRCAQRGIYVVLCSGRAEDGIKPFVSRLNIAALESGKYVIAINGCSIFDMHKRIQIYKKTVSGEVLFEAHKIAVEEGFETEVYSDGKVFYSKETDWTLRDVRMCGLNGEEAPDFEKFLLENQNSFFKMLIPGEPEKIQELQKKLKASLGEKAVIFTSKPYFLEILPPDCGKGEAIEWLSSFIGIDHSTTLAFGDSMNDESMIEKCGYGVAMVNGNEHIKNIADFVTEKTNNDDGVADFIEKYIL